MLPAVSLAMDNSIEIKLGKKLFTDINLSIERNQSCESCHSLSKLKVPIQTKSKLFKILPQSAAGFVDPRNVIDGTAVSRGSIARKFGSLNAPSISYASFSPKFHWDGENFIGGQFWNGRAKNLLEQAKIPFLNPVEMAMPGPWSVVKRLQENQQYVKLFKLVYGLNINKVRRGDLKVKRIFHLMAKSIAAFEKSKVFNKFNSKFDYEAKGMTHYTASEQRGADLFDGDAKCNECHISDGFRGDNSPALLTDFTYDNLGVPRNLQIPDNPKIDPGLLGNPNLNSIRGKKSKIAEVVGKHKVMSLRNIELTAPYMHNGVFKTLKEVVHFYNTRDTLLACVNPNDMSNPEAGITCWPKGEFHATRNVDELGDLGLSEKDENDLVAYLKTFTDNYPIWGNSNGLIDLNIPKNTASPWRNIQPLK